MFDIINQILYGHTIYDAYMMKIKDFLKGTKITKFYMKRRYFIQIFLNFISLYV